MDDHDIQKIIIVTQTPPVVKKHPGGDRTGQSYNRSKMTAEVAEAINVGLYFYEQVSPCGPCVGNSIPLGAVSVNVNGCDDCIHWSVFPSLDSEDQLVN